MKILGITGGSGSGKTTLLRAVERLGGLGLDCDAIYHCLLETDDALVAAIGARFPGTVRDGRVDRLALAAVVFADPAELAALDALTHEAVAREVRRRLWQSEAPFAAIDAIGLFESGLAALCDETVCVLAPEETRIERLIRRDGISRERALARIRAQKSDEALRAQCGHALWADAPTPEAFQQQCEQFLKGVLMMEETKKFEKEREALLSSPKNGYDRISEADLAAMESYCKEYMKFISDCKMEREAVKWTIEAAEKAGFRELKPGMQLKPGDRVYFQITDPKLYTYGVEQPMVAMETLTATTLRNIIGDLELDQTLTSRDVINTKMRAILDEATDPWGIKVTRVELKNILPPQDIQNSMEKQMKAERDRRQAILQAEGTKRSQILVAEGEKESAILRADAEKQSAILRAQGQAEAILAVQKATAEAMQMLNDACPNDQVIKLKALEAMQKVADGKATKIIIPSELQGLAGLAAGLVETVREPKQ